MDLQSLPVQAKLHVGKPPVVLVLRVWQQIKGVEQLLGVGHARVVHTDCVLHTPPTQVPPDVDDSICGVGMPADMILSLLRTGKAHQIVVNHVLTALRIGGAVGHVLACWVWIEGAKEGWKS